jgi:hypothetical protein
MQNTYKFARMANWIKTLALVGCVSVCILAVLLIAIFPRPFVAGHYCTIHRPGHRIVSHSEWRTAVVAWSNPEFSTLRLSPVHSPLRSSDLHTFTCTLNC